MWCLGGYVGIAEGLALPAVVESAANPAEIVATETATPAADDYVATDADEDAGPIVWMPRERHDSCAGRAKCRNRRRVPTPTGAAKERAEALGLGSTEIARHLLVHAPKAEWREAAGQVGDESLLWPIEGGHFGRGFGYVRRERRELPHLGVDVTAHAGSPIRAANDGIVAYSDDGLAGYGNAVMIIHPDGTTTLYAHCAETYVFAGQHVERGQTIAAVGDTGIARGPHLHFEYRQAGRATNPLQMFAARPR